MFGLVKFVIILIAVIWAIVMSFKLGRIYGVVEAYIEMQKIIQQHKDKKEKSAESKPKDMEPKPEDIESSEEKSEDSYKFKNPTFLVLKEVSDLLESMKSTIEKDGHYTVYTLYIELGRPRADIDLKYGWKELNDASITKFKGGYRLNLPMPTLLD